MGLTRREFITRAAAVGFIAGSPYDRIDQLIDATRRRLQSSDPAHSQKHTLPLEQHLFRDVSREVDNDTLVTVPPLHHMAVTANLTVPITTSALQEAQGTLESTLEGMEHSGQLTFTPSGLGLAVAWGLPYFEALPAPLSEAWLPVDLVPSQSTGRTTLALLDAITFASDPSGTILEQNDMAFVIASDHLDHVKTAFDTLFNGEVGQLMTVTSIRRGFVDGAAVGSGRRSLTKTMALEAAIPGAKSIPDSAELFLGFTSTQHAALGPSMIANFEALPGVTDQWPNGYFAHGTTMHLSHIFEDLEAWYGANPQQRAGFAFRPQAEAKVTAQTLTLPEGRDHVASFDRVESDFSRYGFIGHSSSMQPTSRLSGPVVDNYGTTYPTGTAVAQRADFNTLDNPFAYSSDTAIAHVSSDPAAGLHFVVFMPTSSSFNVLRQAMDGQYGSNPPLGPGTVHGPFNQVLQTTHRQNFLVPPRAHRSFPLAEYLS
jgi:hypothetical protein